MGTKLAGALLGLSVTLATIGAGGPGFAAAPAGSPAAGAKAAALSGAPSGGPSRLDHRGRWITDPRGRVVILHGLNMVAKLPPYRPSALGFGADDARFLAREGFDSVRLGIILKGLEPEPGVFDEAYLSDIVRTARILSHEGLRVLIDVHQDLYNERFSGEGFPDWMVQDDGLPAQPDAGFPANYFIMPAEQRAWDHLWANSPGPDAVGLQDAFAAAWRHVARRFRSERGILGYDVLNEPWPGTGYQACLNNYGCPTFDAATLTPFYQRVFAAIRAVDPATLAFYEPSPISSGGPDMHLGDPGDDRAALSFHAYCLGDTVGLPPGTLGPLACPLGIDHTFDNANAQADRNGDAALLTEFGATDDLATIVDNVAAADRAEVGWEYWAYFNEDPSGETPEAGIIVDPSQPPAGDNVKDAKLDALIRPYPRLVAGAPVSWAFSEADPARTFTFTYEADPSIHPATRIFLPSRHYPQGFSVATSGPVKVLHSANDQILRLRSVGAGTVTVTVTAA